MTTKLVVLGIAKDSLGKMHYSFGPHPEFGNYLDDVIPDENAQYDWDGNFYVIKTDNADGLIRAVPEITLLNGEKRKFSHWLVKPESHLMTIYCKDMGFYKGQFGIVGLYYGITDFVNIQRPAIWPMHELKGFDFWLQSQIKEGTLFSAKKGNKVAVPV